MPPVKAPANVLVTGGSGFIGSWVIRKLLERQYSVRAVVRSASKGEYLRKIFQGFPGKFEFIVVSDLEADGALDNALKDMDAVQHLASPVGGDPDQLVGAAVNGTLSVLRSIAKHDNIRRVVLTSSAAALREPKEYPCVYTEEDWNISATIALEKGDTTPEQKYYASKTLAEKAAWDFARKASIDLITLLPSVVIGPILHEVPSLDRLNYSSALFYGGIVNEKPSGATFANWVDVRDVADAHALVMEEKKAAGRFITSAGPASWQHIYDALNSGTPKLQNIPQGHVGKTEGIPGWRFNSEKIEKLGMRFMPLAQSARDTVLSMRERGW